MKMKNALSLTENQTYFLRENRQDPITGDDFSIGDEIVFCAECKSAFLKESWEYMGSKHCNQREILANFPMESSLKLRKAVVYDFKKVEMKERIEAFMIDLLIGIMFAALVAFCAYSFFGVEEYVLCGIGVASLYMIFRDIVFINSSVGKKAKNLYFINTRTKEKANLYMLSIRNLIYWLINLTLLFTIANVAFKDPDYIVPSFCALLVLFLVNSVYLVESLKGYNFIDKLLQIELVQKK